MEIERRINFNAQLRDENESLYVSFNGSVDEKGIPYTSYTISDNDKYLANVKTFRKSKSEFEDAVFDEADRVVAEVEAKKASTTTTTVK